MFPVESLSSFPSDPQLSGEWCQSYIVTGVQWPRLSPAHNGALEVENNLSMTSHLNILNILLVLLSPGSPQTMDAYNSTAEVEEAESFFSSMDFHVSSD